MNESAKQLDLFPTSEPEIKGQLWDELQGEMPDAELKRMEEQATRFLDSLRREISERSK